MIITKKNRVIKTKPIVLFYFILFTSFLGLQQGHSQDRITLQGKVTNLANEEPVSDAKIIIRNVRNGTISDSEGNYTLGGIKSGDIIEVSKLGFRTVTYTVKGKRKNQRWDVSLSADLLSLSEVVVTNFGNTKDEEKIQSSVAITTISNEEIDQRLPRSNTDLLKAIPGFWVESAGGEGPGSVWVRGFPQSGGYTFLGLMEDGLPVFQVGYFALGDQFYRIDESLQKVEAIRGGTAPIIMQGASGAVVNHITKTGSQIFKGVAKVAYGPEQDLGRIDVNLGGPISKSTTYNVGGFYRNDTGVYDYGYRGNRGGQIRANVLQKLNKVKLKYQVKYLNDNVNWNLPSPYTFNKNGDIGDIPSFNLKTDGIGTDNSDTEFSYRLPSGDLKEIDLKDGFFTNLFSAGLEADFTLSKNWSLVNKFRFDNITHDNTSDIVTNVFQLNENDTYEYSDGTPVTNPESLNGNGLFINNFLLSNENDYDIVINRLELSNKTKKNALTLGGEFFSYKLLTTSFSAVSNKEVKNAPRRIFDVNPANPATQLAQNGITPTAFVNRDGITKAEGTETTFSFYGNDKWNVSDKFRLDIGARLDIKSVKGNNYAKSGESVLAGGGGFVLSNNKIEFEDSRTSLSTTIGLNYKVSENSAFYLRSALAGGSIKIGNYDDEVTNIEILKNTKSNQVFQTELGYKFRGEKTGLFASLVYATLSDAITPIILPNTQGGLVFQNVFISTRTVSAEVEAQYKPTNKLLFRLIGTLQDAQYTDLNFVAPAGTIVADERFDWSGNEAERTPKVAASLNATYSHKKLVLSGDIRYHGDRWSTPANNVKLKGYSEFNLGLKYIFNKNLYLSMQAANLFNTVALVEGDSRGDQFIDPDVIDGQVRIGKRNLPRLILFKLGYNFGK